MATPPFRLRFQLQELYTQTSDAVVRVVWGGEYEAYIANGVVVTAEGHVVLVNGTRPADNKVAPGLFGQHIKTGDPLVFYFGDGRRAVGVAAGWSEEYKVSLAKISDKGTWPHVSLPKRVQPINVVGDACVSLGYNQVRGGRYDQKPAMRLGNVTQSIPDSWLACSSRMNSFDAVFSSDGQFLGITTHKLYGSNPVQTDAAVIAMLWPHLVAGENVDRIRLHSSEATRNIELLSKVKEREDAQSLERVKLATVRIQGRSAWSGVVFRRDGYVATCAHHGHLAGEKVTVMFSDGRDVPAQVLGTSPVADIALVKISQNGEWPHVKLGSSLKLSPTDHCIISGFPMGHKEREPLIRESKVVESPEGWSCSLRTGTPSRLRPGDSGGGVFDAQGRLVAVHQRMDERQLGRHQRIELFRLQWHVLTSKMSSLQQQNKSMVSEEDVSPNNHAVVNILANGQQCALGTVVNKGGKIVTKASELHGEITCRFSNGSEVAAQVERVSRELDLALLRVDKTDLRVSQFDDATTHLPGLMLLAPIPPQSVKLGMVSLQERSTPVNRGGRFPGFRNTDRGVELIDSSWVQQSKLPLRNGDVVLSVDGHATPNLSSFTALLNGDEKPRRLAKEGGDRASLSVRRSGETINLEFQLPSSSWPRPNESRRCSGFPVVFDADIPLRPKQCGGPVMDSKGRIAGIVIACRAAGLSHVIPSRVLRQFLDNKGDD